jgi:hypothetical protein
MSTFNRKRQIMEQEPSTQDEIIEMAREAGGEFYVTSGNQTPTWYFSHSTMYDFVNLVAAKEQKKWQDQTAVEIHEAVLEEREACAKLCEEEQEYWGWDKVFDAAKLIRARGEQA